MIIFDPIQAQPAVWNRLVRIHQRGKAGSAYLFGGPPGSAKEALAIEFAKLLNCENSGDRSCNECPSCRRIQALQHENLTLVFPLPKEGASSAGDDPLRGLSDKTLALINAEIEIKARDPFHKIALPRANTIPINAIRELRRTAYLKTALSGRRAILIFDAHLLSTGEGASANALLKILEEPPPATTFILVSDHKGSLPPTILSRCQQVDFPPLADRYIAGQIAGADPELIAGLAAGNLHLARKLTNQPPAEIRQRIDNLVHQVLQRDGAGWRSFINSQGRLAGADPQEYNFNFYLLQIWFRAAYRRRLGVDDPLHAGGLGAQMEQLNQANPAIDYPGINNAVAEATAALANNYYIPLTLINFLTTIQRRMRGR
ncbi:MAG: hypothetical protein ABIA75_09270 [Candidatus Neomarinimicrobiota bacterium]